MATSVLVLFKTLLFLTLAGISMGIYDQPFGSHRLCSDVLNETLRNNRDQIIIEQLLVSTDSKINSFPSSASIDGSNPELEAWANQACLQMQNLIDYLYAVCRTSSGTTYPKEMAALLKLRALAAAKNYLCNNNRVNLREMALNNGAQCARRTDLKSFRCSNQETVKPPSFIPNAPVAPNMYGTEIILSGISYSGDSCRIITGLTKCIENNYARGTDFCSPRASNHFSRIFGIMLQAVECPNSGLSPFNNVQYNSYNGQQQHGSNNVPYQQSGSFGTNAQNAFPTYDPINNWNNQPTLAPPYKPKRNSGNKITVGVSLAMIMSVVSIYVSTV